MPASHWTLVALAASAAVAVLAPVADAAAGCAERPVLARGDPSRFETVGQGRRAWQLARPGPRQPRANRQPEGLVRNLTLHARPIAPGRATDLDTNVYSCMDGMDTLW
jgi:hypothetical protein